MIHTNIAAMLLSSFTDDLIEAGCDEAGRGCLAGPVVAAAVIMPKNWRHKELDDSKKLSKKKLSELKLIIQTEALAWAVSEVSNVEIDKINILNASFKAMHRAISTLKIKPELLLIDGNRFNPYREVTHECIIKGDGKYLSIAAASVLAKTYRDELMISLAKEFPDYGWEFNVGYPTKLHRDGIRQKGLTPLHRKSFRQLPLQTELFTRA